MFLSLFDLVPNIPLLLDILPKVASATEEEYEAILGIYEGIHLLLLSPHSLLSLFPSLPSFIHTCLLSHTTDLRLRDRTLIIPIIGSLSEMSLSDDQKASFHLLSTYHSLRAVSSGVTDSKCVGKCRRVRYSHFDSKFVDQHDFLCPLFPLPLPTLHHRHPPIPSISLFPLLAMFSATSPIYPPSHLPHPLSQL